MECKSCLSKHNSQSSIDMHKIMAIIDKNFDSKVKHSSAVEKEK